MTKRKKKGTDDLVLSKNLKAIRRMYGVTIRDLAKIAGVAPSVIQSWKDGHVPHSIRSVAKIARYYKPTLGTTLKSILFEEVEEW